MYFITTGLSPINIAPCPPQVHCKRYELLLLVPTYPFFIAFIPFSRKRFFARLGEDGVAHTSGGWCFLARPSICRSELHLEGQSHSPAMSLSLYHRAGPLPRLLSLALPLCAKHSKSSFFICLHIIKLYNRSLEWIPPTSHVHPPTEISPNPLQCCCFDFQLKLFI